ncbi:MAG: HD domain-containing protein [Bdellovibrionales bacterium]|nr:HD domain-containing protein [Bdellovibrionales bacterium]
MAWDDVPDWAKDVTASILQAVKEKDEHTFFHCCRVGRNAKKLAKSMGLNEFEQVVLEFSGLFHDVGKVGIPDNILLKQGRLDKDEIEVMKAHPLKSAQIIEPLSTLPLFRFTLPGVRYHHERMDGTGYPFNLLGEKIPLFARIVSIVDCVDAMSHARSYRKALPAEKIIQELKDFSGIQFDANIVKIYLEASPHWNKESQKDESTEIIVRDLLKKAA